MTSVSTEASCEVTSANYINFVELQGVVKSISQAAKPDGTLVCLFSLDTGEAALNAEDTSPLLHPTNHIRCKIVGGGAHDAYRELRDGQLYHCFGRLVQVNYINESTGRAGVRHEVIVFRGTVVARPPIRNETPAEQTAVFDIPFPPKDKEVQRA